MQPPGYRVNRRRTNKPMYESFYQLERLPFETTPDPRFFYASEQHREALAAIEYTIKMRKGVVLVTGEIGSGKTTVGRTMLERCNDQATLVQLNHGHETGNEMLRHVLRNIGMNFDADSDHSLLLEQLERALIDHAEQGKPIVLFVDEAQTLSDESLEELRLLSNFDTNTRRLLQLVLIGQPELHHRISGSRLCALRQRIVMWKQLSTLSGTDTAGYIRHRIAMASHKTQRPGVVFGAEAIEAIYGFTGGIPRLINIVCDNCLLLGLVKRARRITPNMVRRVIDDMMPSFGPGTGASERDTFKLAGAA